MRAQLERDFERFKRALPPNVAAHVLDAYAVDLTARYLGQTLSHPIGKASGQLSLKEEQLEADVAAGLSLVVLKTVIAQDEAGERAMAAWAAHETRMRVERRTARSGREGWTVTWKGRGWDRTLDDYLALVRTARQLTRASGGGTLIVPSAKYHLPRTGEAFRQEEYRHTTHLLADAWGEEPLLLEKDFSPTLAGDALSDERDTVLRWLREVPALIREAMPKGGGVAVKVMNARFDDDFQLEMLEAAADADALVVFNRLWDFKAGVAYGGFDLSERNLRVLDAARGRRLPPLVGTGNICSGRQVIEYALRGCESVQLHTYFQLPLTEYPATHGTRTARALHSLVFDPQEGLIAGLLDLEAEDRLARRDGVLHFLDLTQR